MKKNGDDKIWFDSYISDQFNDGVYGDIYSIYSFLLLLMLLFCSVWLMLIFILFVLLGGWVGRGKGNARKINSKTYKSVNSIDFILKISN